MIRSIVNLAITESGNVKESDQIISDHYTVNDLGSQILDALAASGKDIDALTVDDLSPVDAFHIRGRAATEEISQLLGAQPSEKMLDVGCGLGGTSRFIASTLGCDVTGLDLTDDYCRVATMLSEKVGLSERTRFVQGSALALPFDDQSFDIVLTEHVQMNIEDKAGFYNEIARVLKPSGRFAFHDIFAGKNDNLQFPLPWASDQSSSHLASIPDLEQVLTGLGFERLHWEDKTDASKAFFGVVFERVQREGRMPLGLHLLMGENADTKFANLQANLEENRVRVVLAVLTKPSAEA